MAASDQLTFEVWGPKGPPEGDARPLVATLAVSGKLEGAIRELYQDEEVVVTVAGQDGEILASGHARVDVGFKRKKAAGISYLEREQKAKVEAEE